ncbi:hypothetical protein Tco_0896251, partial [Tanacetum coccineum]
MQKDPCSCYQAKVRDGLAGINCPPRVTCLLYDDQIRSKLWNGSKLNFEMAVVGAIWSKFNLVENPNVSGFKTKQPSKELQEAWEQLFGGLLAGGSVVVGLGMDQDTSSEIPNVNLENAEIPNVNHENVEIPNVNLKNVAINIDDDTEPIQVWNHYSQHLDAKENDFYSSLMRDVGQDVPTPCSDEISRQPNKSKNVTTKPKIVEMKQKGRNS